MVVASRMITHARNEEDDQIFKIRKWLCKIAAVAMSLIWKKEGSMIWDIVHGMRGMLIDSFFSINPIPYGISIDLEIVIGAYKNRYPRIEFPVEEYHAIDNRSTHFRTIPTIVRHLKYLFYEIFFRRN